MPTGERWSVDVPSGNGKFCLYGTLNIATGEPITEAYPKGKFEHTTFLEQVLEGVEGQILLVWNPARWHTSQAVEETIARHERFETVLLLKRSPEANSVEDLWRQLKNTVRANLERSLDALREACRQFFDDLLPAAAFEMAGLR